MYWDCAEVFQLKPKIKWINPYSLSLSNPEFSSLALVSVNDIFIYTLSNVRRQEFDPLSCLKQPSNLHTGSLDVSWIDFSFPCLLLTILGFSSSSLCIWAASFYKVPYIQCKYSTIYSSDQLSLFL